MPLTHLLQAGERRNLSSVQDRRDLSRGVVGKHPECVNEKVALVKSTHVRMCTLVRIARERAHAHVHPNYPNPNYPNYPSPNV